MKKQIYIFGMIFLTALSANVAAAQIASGGAFTLDQSVIASGGASSSGGQFSITDTTGQSIAGQKATIAPFSAHAGFWNPAPLAPTAANVAISGQVLTADGRGIRNALVTLTTGDGTSRTVLTGKFGAFRFAEIPAGETSIISVRAKRFTFVAPTQVVFAAEDLSGINFIAEENQSL